MDNATYVQTNLIPAVTLIILYFNSRAKLPFSRSNRLLRHLLLLVLAMLTADTAATLLNGAPGLAARRALWLFNSLYFLLSGAIALCWFFYVSSRVCRKFFPPRRYALLIPFLLYAVVLVAGACHGTIFTLDEANRYHRGPLFFLQYALGISYLLAATGLALWYMRGRQDPDERREYRNIALFTAFPAAGATLQVLFYGLVVLWPLTAAALLLIYITIQRGQIALDGLTGLNNRGRLDEYLADRCRRTRPGHPWYLMLIDLDDFKQINDVYGHAIGDEALRQVAQLLKRTFLRSDAFLARYGGDEFAVVLSCTQDSTVLAEVQRLNQAARHTVWNAARPLALSVGYARFEGAAGDDALHLIARADEAMYQIKRKRKHAADTAAH